MQFLSQFAFLYTEKRITYEELFDLYKDCRRKMIPDYRWEEEVVNFLRRKRSSKNVKI